MRRDETGLAKRQPRSRRVGACDCLCISLLRSPAWGGPSYVGHNSSHVVQPTGGKARQVSVSTGHMDEWRPREPERRAAGQRPCSAWLSLQAFLTTGMLPAYRMPTRWHALGSSVYARLDRNDGARHPPIDPTVCCNGKRVESNTCVLLLIALMGWGKGGRPSQVSRVPRASKSSEQALSAVVSWPWNQCVPGSSVTQLAVTSHI